MNTRYLPLFVFLLCIVAFTCNKKTNEANQKNNPDTTTTTTETEGGTPRNEGDPGGQARPTDINEIQGAWTVRSVSLKEGQRVEPLQYYHVYIDEQGVHLPLDINTCNATYKVKRDSLAIGVMSCTEACCDKKEAQAIANFMSSTLQFRKEDRNLYLSNGKGLMELFQPTLILPNTRWKAVAYRPKAEEVKPVLFSKPYVLAFKDMRVQLELDANNCMSSYTYNEKTIHIPNPFGCSKKCCDSKDGVLLRDMLTGRLDYEIDGNNLTITTKKEVINFVMDSSELED